MVDRGHFVGVQVVDGLFELVGHEVVLRPVAVVLSVFKDGEVDSPELFRDAFEARVVSPVSAHVDAGGGSL